MKFETPWLNFREMSLASKNRRIIFWGCFDYFEKTMVGRKFNIEYLVDISKSTQGEKAHYGYDVRPPSVLKNIKNKKDYYIIVTSSAFYEIIDELVGWGFFPGEDFCITPVLQRFKFIDDIRNYSPQILFSSSDSVKKMPDGGGGLYLFDGKRQMLEKKVSGITRGFTSYNGMLFVVDALSGVRILDNRFKDVDKFDLPHQSTPHGIAIDHKRKRIMVVLSTLDKIAVYDIESYKQVGEIKITEKHDRSGGHHHHLNDICVYEDSIFITMFSRTGNTGLNCFDGCVLEYDIESDKIIGEVVRDLWQPHTPKIIDGSLAFLDSMRGNLHIESHKVESHFNGFIRGMDYDGQYYVLAQSVHRYYDRLKSVSNNISTDCGLFIYDSVSKLSRFIPMPKIADINTLFLLEHMF